MPLNKPNVAAIVLAGGAASRMGLPKLLLSWKGETLIHRVSRIALEGGMAPVIVVTGAGADKVNAAIKDLSVTAVINPNWEKGQSTSVRVGIKALPKEVNAVIFLLGDQPFVSPLLIRELIKSYSLSHPAILAPFVGGKRGNPVLFDRSIFKVLTELKGDTGARSIFRQYPPTAMPWDDERLLFDIDTPEDYQKLTDTP